MVKMIEIKHVTKRYAIVEKNKSWKRSFDEKLKLQQKRHLTALDDICFEVEKGEIFGLLGPNGAGKTTTLKLIAGFLLPEEGSISVNGYDVVKNRHEARTSCNILRGEGWVIFDYSYPIYKLLEFWGIFMGTQRKEAKEKVDEVLSIVDLLDKRNEYPENLSSGMLQRLNLARCLMVSRPIYLLDEPTGRIDPYSASFIRNYVKNEIAGNGATIVLATNNIWEAEALCDRLVILEKGKIQMLGSTKEIKSALGKEKMVVEMEHCNEDLIEELLNLSCIIKIEPEKNTLNIYGKEFKHNLPQIISICSKYSTIKSVDVFEPSLEEIFIKLIGDLR
jgi:ABC-2 type transport system ATP-binding protein